VLSCGLQHRAFFFVTPKTQRAPPPPADATWQMLDEERTESITDYGTDTCDTCSLGIRNYETVRARSLGGIYNADGREVPANHRLPGIAVAAAPLLQQRHVVVVGHARHRGHAMPATSSAIEDRDP
jgi:hypothetical protein